MPFYMYMCVSVCVRACVCVRVYVCVFIYLSPKAEDLFHLAGSYFGLFNALTKESCSSITLVEATTEIVTA